MPLSDLSFLFEDHPNPMWIFEQSSLKILRVNKAAVEKYGYSREEFVTMHMSDLCPGEEKDRFAGQNYKNGVYKHLNKNGEIIYAETTAHSIKLSGIDCGVMIAADATEKVLRQEELLWTKSNLEALINNTEDLIWSVDRETRYVYMNKAYRSLIARITGIEPKEGDYSYLHKGYTLEEIEKWDQYYQRALQGERYIIINESTDLLTQEVLSFEISFNPIYKIKGDITGVGCFSRNITDRLATEKAIVDQNERLRHIASVTSHELRRPVASMLGLISIMDRENFFNPDNKDVIEHLLVVGNEIDEVIRLIIDKTFMDGPTKNKYLSP